MSVGRLALLLAAACCLRAGEPPAAAAPRAAPRRAEAYYEYSRALQAWAGRDLQEALQALERAAGADPASADLQLEMARLQAELGDLQQAEVSARRAVERVPESAAARRLLADLLFARATRDEGGRELLEQTAHAYREAVRLAPDDAEAHLQLGKLQIALRAWPGALETLQRHLALAPRSEEGAFLAGECLMKLARPSEAAALLEQAVDGRPESLQLGMALLEATEAAGRVEEALVTGERLLKRRPDLIPLRFAVARLHMRMKRPAEAIEHLEEASRVMQARPAQFTDADRADVELRIVGALLDAGRRDEAITKAEEGEKRYPSDLRFALRRAESLLAARRTGEASALFDRLRGSSDEPARIEERVSDVYLSTGARFERAGDSAQAEKHLRRAIDVNPTNAAALNYLGYMLAVRGVQLDEAIELIERALERDPQNGAYLDSLGWAYFRKGDYLRAERALATALSALPEEAEIHAHLGEVYAATGRPADAIRSWQEALARGAEDAEQIRAKLSEAERAARVTP